MRSDSTDVSHGDEQLALALLDRLTYRTLL